MMHFTPLEVSDPKKHFNNKKYELNSFFHKQKNPALGGVF
tara:strand:- start:381 stop:500 length:120 start_codon:yes stop_codon:yes gene_type:complete